jgi:hypothetical protein
MLLFHDDSEAILHHQRLANVASILILLALRHRPFNVKKRKCSGHLRRGELMPAPRQESPWQALYQSREDRAYITTMGIDVKTFDYLLAAGFKDAWDSRPIRRSDVNPNGATRLGARSLDAPGALGLLLHYLCSTMGETGLQQIFAIVPSVLSRYIRFGMPILLEALLGIAEGAIVWPTIDEMRRYAEMIKERHPQIDGGFGFLDGLNLPVGTSSDPLIENAMYNGWLHAHKISNVIAFAPDGRFSIHFLYVYFLIADTFRYNHLCPNKRTWELA